MLANDLAAAIGVARPNETHALAQALWRGHAAGLVTDEEAEHLAAAIEARRTIASAPKRQVVRRRVGSRPAKPAHIERRRRWAASGKMPANLAHRFTLAEQAVLGAVAHEVKAKGDCRKSNKELADIAGVSLSTAKNALREAKALGLIVVQERRLRRMRNDTNVVSIVSAEWRAWLRLGGAATPWGRGHGSNCPIDTKNPRTGISAPIAPRACGAKVSAGWRAQLASL